jgi:hypothetical protein
LTVETARPSACPGWRMRAVYVPVKTNAGSAFMRHVVLIWTVRGHTYGIGFHKVHGLGATGHVSGTSAGVRKDLRPSKCGLDDRRAAPSEPPLRRRERRRASAPGRAGRGFDLRRHRRVHQGSNGPWERADRRARVGCLLAALGGRRRLRAHVRRRRRSGGLWRGDSVVGARACGLSRLARLALGWLEPAGGHGVG